MSRWEKHNLADPLIPGQKRLGLLRQPVQAQSTQSQFVQPQPVQPAFQPTNVMDVPVSNMPSARQQSLDKYANTLTNMSLFATLATGKSIRDYGAAFRTQPTGQKDKVQDQVYSNIGALLQKARAAGVDLSDQRKVYDLGTQAGITDPRYMKVLLDAAKNSRAPAGETAFTSFYDKGGNESRYIKGTQGYSDAVKDKNLTTSQPTAYDLGTLWNAEGEPRTYKNRQQELAAREEGFNRTSSPTAADAEKYDAFSFRGPNGEWRKGYKKHVDRVPHYFFEDGTAVPKGWRVQDIKGGDATSTALTKTNEEVALIDKMDIAAETYGEDSEQYKRAKRGLDIFRSNLVSRTETGSPGAFSLGKSDSEQASAELVDQSFDLGNFSNLLKDVEQFSKATGLRGVGIETIGGVLGQINPALEDGFVQTLGGMSTEDAANLRNRLQLAVVSLIPEYTGEESNRISDRERVLAENASRLKSITASPRQIRTALLNVMELKFAGRMRNLITLRGKPQYDLLAENKEARHSNVNALGARLMDYGMSKDEAFSMMVNLKSLQKELMELASLRNESN